jgi:hypothetical protein
VPGEVISVCAVKIDFDLAGARLRRTIQVTRDLASYVGQFS